jgi:hypothetical protein
MKKTYTTPTLIIGDDIVHATLGGDNGSPETMGQVIFKAPPVGGVGYYL